MRSKLSLFIILASISTIFISCGRNNGQTSGESNSIQIKGSDTMVNLTQAWAERFMQKNPHVLVAVTGGGSGTGFASLLNGTCDMAQSSRKIKDKELASAKDKEIEPIEYIVGLDGIAVIVHPDNPVNQLTIDQLADVFTGKIKNWKEIGGHDGTIVLLSREVNSGTHVYFKEHVLRHEDSANHSEFDEKALLMPSSQAIADEIVQNINTIGYYGMGYLNSSQKALAIAKDIKSPYYLPSVENVKQGKYYISRPLLMYTNGQPKGLIKDFIDFVLSEEGQKIVKEIDFVPVR